MTEREIAEMLREVPTLIGPSTGLEYADYDAMARAVAGLINEQAARHADCCVDRQELADRDARLARLGEALKAMMACIDDQVFVRNITNDDHFPSYVAQGSRIVAVLTAAQDALADAGAGKERG